MVSPKDNEILASAGHEDMGNGSCVSEKNMGVVPPTRIVFNGTKQPHTLLSVLDVSQKDRLLYSQASQHIVSTPS
ncbi:hypothetical protein ACSQ67_007058 [Phaseolus vulgaris]